MTLASLNHPNIAAIYDVQEAGGSRYIVLKLVDGAPLSQFVQRGSSSTNLGEQSIKTEM